MRAKQCFTLAPLREVFKADWRWWLLGAALSFVVASILMSGWPTGLLPNLEYPYTYSGDGLSTGWMIQRAMESWIFENPRSGYPFGSNFLDFPGSDSGSHLILKFLGSLTGQYGAALNLYFLLGFSITFVVAYCVFRAVSLERSYAFAAAMLFAFLPFHFQRLDHLYYTWYFSVPLFYYIALQAFKPDTVGSTGKPGRLENGSPYFLLLAISSFGVYYALFGLIVISVAGLSGYFAHANFNSIKLSVAAAGVIILGVLVNVAPNLIHKYVAGPNSEVAQRSPGEGEMYGLKMMQLITPHHGHRIEAFEKFSAKYNATAPLINENATSSLGTIGAAGLMALFAIAFLGMSGRGADGKLMIIALIVFALFLFGTIGGLGSVFSYSISSSIRGWNRISVFIGFGALFGVFTLLQLYLKGRFASHRLPLMAALLAGGLLVVGLYDQTFPTCDSCNDNAHLTFSQDKEFVQSIETLLPQGAAVYQLPYMAFPEVAPLNRLETYGLAAGFLHSRSLRWSYAGMKGREGDLFYRSLASESLERQLEIINKLGFSGIYIDRRGYEDNGRSVIGRLTEILQSPPSLIHPNGTVVFFKLDQDADAFPEGLGAREIMLKAGYWVDRLGLRYEATLAEGIEFSRPDFPTFVRDVRGLSGQEPWGRWTDANLASSMVIDLNEPLPDRFNLVFYGHPFGPNTDRYLKVRIGSKEFAFKMLAGETEYKRLVDLGGEKVSSVEFVLPYPTSPQELSLSSDGRKLGIGLAKLRFEALPK